MTRVARMASRFALITVLVLVALVQVYRMWASEGHSSVLPAPVPPALVPADCPEACVCPLTDAAPNFNHTFQLGKVPASSIQSATISVRNLRSHPFVVQTIRRTCSCTQVQQDFKVLAAGATGHFRITMATASDEVVYAPHVRIAFDDGAGGSPGVIAVVLSMNAVKPLTVEQDTLLLGSLSADGSEHAFLDVHRGKMDLAFTSVTASCSLSAITSAVSPIDGNTWRITLQQRAPLPFGALDGILSLRPVSASPMGDGGRLDVPIVGIVSGSWSISSSMFLLGSSSMGKTSSAEYLVRLPGRLEAHSTPAVAVVAHPKDLDVVPSSAPHDESSFTLRLQVTPRTLRVTSMNR